MRCAGLYSPPARRWTEGSSHHSRCQHLPRKRELPKCRRQQPMSTPPQSQARRGSTTSRACLPQSRSNDSGAIHGHPSTLLGGGLTHCGALVNSGGRGEHPPAQSARAGPRRREGLSCQVVRRCGAKTLADEPMQLVELRCESLIEGGAHTIIFPLRSEWIRDRSNGPRISE